MNPTGSFRKRLTWMMLLLLFATTSAFFFLNYQIEKKILIDQKRQRAVLMAKTLRVNLLQLILQPNSGDLANIPDDEKVQIRNFLQRFDAEQRPIDKYSRNEWFHNLFFIDADSKVIIDYPAENEGLTLPPEDRIDPHTLSKLKKNEIDLQMRKRGNELLLFLTFPLFQKEDLLGFGRIEMSLMSVMAFLGQIKLWSLIAGLCLFLIGFLLVSYFARTVTKPIDELVRAAVRAGQGDLDQRLDESRKDELGLLKIAFNRMAKGLLELKETQKRVEKLEVASLLGARVAHEIKNPLNSIGLIIDHFKDRFTPREKPAADKFLELTENMRQELKRLNDIVEGFLRFAKPASLAHQPANLNDLIDEAVAFIKQEADKQRVRIDRHFDPAVPKTWMDYHSIRQVLLNLLLNALQAMPEGGEIRISTSTRKNGAEEIMVSIRDTGCGIPKENLPKLFDPYFTTKARGFGLGLSIVERTVQEHGGRVEVMSEPGKGATFTLFLPVKLRGRHA